MFETYEELSAWLTERKRRVDMSSLHSFLERCVEEEAEVLLREEMRTQGRKRSSKRLKNQCRAEAEEQYVEEISAKIADADEFEMTQWTVIAYRRRPKVWAISEEIRLRIELESA